MLNDKIKEVLESVKELKGMIKAKKEDEEEKENQKNKHDFLKDVINKPTLKHVEKIVKEQPEENDLIKAMRERRKDIEPDVYDDSDEEWGEGIKTLKTSKVIKFKDLLNMLK